MARASMGRERLEFGPSLTHELRVEEYRALRQELLQRVQRKYQMTIGYVSLSMAIIAFSYSHDPALRVLPAIIVAVGTTLILVEDRMIRSISAFLISEYESVEKGPRWEKILLTRRSEILAPPHALMATLRWLFYRGMLPIGLSLYSLIAWLRADEFWWSAAPILLISLIATSVALAASRDAFRASNVRRSMTPASPPDASS